MERADFDVMGELFGTAVQQALQPGPADSAARLQGELIVCGEVWRNLETYRPHPVPSRPRELRGWDVLSPDEMRSAVRNPDDKQTRGAYGKFRLEVTEAEAANTQRLQVLVSTVQTLARLRTQLPDRAADIDKGIDAVGNWIVQVWKLTPPLGSSAGELRTWCRKQTWRPDVLPFAWRGL